MPETECSSAAPPPRRGSARATRPPTPRRSGRTASSARCGTRPAPASRRSGGRAPPRSPGPAREARRRAPPRAPRRGSTARSAVPVMRSGRLPAPHSCTSRPSAGVTIPASTTAWHDPIVGCPANGSSCAGREDAQAVGRARDRRLQHERRLREVRPAAIRCISSDERSSAPSTTATGLPRNGRAVNASTCLKRSGGIMLAPSGAERTAAKP